MASFPTHAQYTIEGYVLDAATRQPVPFAHLYLSTEQRGTVSNEEGGFLLASNTPATEVVVSHVGYETQKLLPSADSIVYILLHPQADVLPEVTVTSESASSIVQKAIGMAKAYSSLYFAKGFYRQTTQYDSTLTQMHEVFYDLALSTQGIQQYGMEHARYAELPSHRKETTYKNFSYLTLGFKTYKHKQEIRPDNIIHPIIPEVDEYYQISVAGYTKLDSGTLIQIVFKSKLKDSSLPIQEGSVFINVDTYDIVRLLTSAHHSLTENISKTSDNHVCRWDISFDQTDSIPVLRYINTVFTYDKKVRRKKRSVAVNSLLTIYDLQNHVEINQLKPVSIKTYDMDEILKVDYDASFWKDNPIIKRTPAEEKITNTLEAEGAFKHYQNN
ncbi:MAG: carboxypeptidase-like regulatory domain-containing protein [Tunicatimonas sp.]